MIHDIRRLLDAAPEGETWTMPAFLAAHTFHDADFLGALALDDGKALLWIRLDKVWNPGVRARVFYFPTAYALRWRDGCFNMSTISGAVSTPLGPTTREALLDERSLDYCGDAEHPAFDEGLTRTHLACVNSLELEILHGAEIRVFPGEESHGP